MKKVIGIIGISILVVVHVLFAVNGQGFNPSLDWSAVSLADLDRFRWDLILSDKSQIIDLPTSQTNQQALVRFSDELAAKLKAEKIDLSGAEKLTWRDGTLYNG
ncbi:MAG: hypothetical protein AABX52_01640, partial [Nanoarchaeota archaeon]